MTRKIIRLSEQIIPKYYEMFNSNIMHTILTSGRAGTKSSGISILSVWEIVSKNNCSVVILRKFHNKLKKTAFTECLKAINRLGLNKKLFKITISPMQITYLPKGNTIYFTGNDSIDDTKGMVDEKNPITLVVLDELTEFFDKGDGEDELVNIEATFVRGNNASFRMIYSFNPPRNPKAPIMQWVDKMVKRNDCVHLHTDYRDVPVQWLGQKLIDSALEMKKSDETMYDWLWLGKCTGLEGVIYFMFDEEKHIAELTDEQKKQLAYMVIGIDYGQMNATTFQAYGMDYKDKCMRGLDEYYHSGRETGHQKTPSEYAQDFKEFVERLEATYQKKVAYFYIDPSAKGLKEEIKRVCPTVESKDADNSVYIGITRQQNLLSLNRLFLSPSQKHLIQEMYLYEWDKDAIEKGLEKPIKDNDHCQDATRYAVMGEWRRLKKLLPILRNIDKGDEDESNQQILTGTRI